MIRSKSDRQWEKIGSTDPLYGVWTQEAFRSTEVDAAALRKFWSSGEQHVEKMFASIYNYFPKKQSFLKALDFGCGVGRLLIPLSEKCAEVVGVDVSCSMLACATIHLQERGVSNATTICSGDAETLGVEEYDLVHSHIVLQHVQTSRGYRILDALIASLKSGGVGVIHLTYQNNSPLKRFHWLLRLPLPEFLTKVLTGGRVAGPVMEMNEYNLNAVFSKLQRTTSQHVHIEFTDHGAYGVILYFCKD